jgi:phage regulator Rha-like protein
MTPKLIPLPDTVITEKIHVIRGQKVILDRDLAELYGVKPFRLREQVKRNQDRFPALFMFQLTPNELRALVSQNAIPGYSRLGGTSPYAFTEHGALMVANVLKSEQAVAMSIRIIDLFVRMREMLMTQKDLLLKVEQLEQAVRSHDKDLDKVFACLKELLTRPDQPRQRIGYKN